MIGLVDAAINVFDIIVCLTLEDTFVFYVCIFYAKKGSRGSRAMMVRPMEDLFVSETATVRFWTRPTDYLCKLDNQFFQINGYEKALAS